MLFLAGCATARKNNFPPAVPAVSTSSPWESPFISGFEKALFRTSLQIRDFTLSGITLVKKSSDSSFRVVMTSEIGMTFFDIELRDAKFIPHYIFAPLNYRPVKKILEENFRVLLLPQTIAQKVSPSIDKQTGSIEISNHNCRFHLTLSPLNR